MRQKKEFQNKNIKLLFMREYKLMIFTFLIKIKVLNYGILENHSNQYRGAILN